MEGVIYDSSQDYLRWLPLDLFDNEEYDDYGAFEWLEKSKNTKIGQLALKAKGLLEEQSGSGKWEAVLINEWYEPESEFIGVSEATGKRMRFKRINLCFDIEDPRKFAKRVAWAHQNRKVTDARVRYNFYIDNMPTQELNDIDYEQKTRLTAYATNSKQ